MTFKLRMCCLAVVVVATACAHASGPRSPALYGSYRFSDAIPGLGIVSGRFDVSDRGQVTKFSGACSHIPAARSGDTSVGCRVQRLRIAVHDSSTVRAVSVEVLVSESTPSPTNRAVSDVRYKRYRGRLSATRSGW